MKKYKVSVLITEARYVDYEIMAENKQAVKEMVSDGVIEDYGTPVNETIPEIVGRDIGQVMEVKE